MDKVQEEVEQILNRPFGGDKYDLYYGTSFDDIPFAVLTTKDVWYKVWTIGNVEGRVDTSKAKLENILVEDTEHLTEEGAQQHFQEYKEELTKGMYNCLFPRSIVGEPMLATTFQLEIDKLPKEAITDPDRYIQPGDLLDTHFVAGTSHWGIYIGNSQVVHVSGHGGGKSASVARIGKLCPDFVDPDGTIWKVTCPYHFRKPEKIVAIAKDYAEQGFRQGEYHLIAQNCQHFATLCAFGVDVSPYVFEAMIAKLLGELEVP